MKKKTILLFMMVKLFILQSLFFSMLFAVDTEGQKSKNVYQVFVSLNTNELTLKKAFSEIEKNTKYKFNFHEEDLNLHETISLETGTKSVGEYLKQISSQTGLRFEQVNNVIMVSPIAHYEESRDEFTEILQTKRITGQVNSAEDNSPMPGVSVLVKGTTIGVVTDSEGRFSIDVPGNAVLVFTFIGFLNEEVQVNEESSLTISMVPDIKKLEEVVVIGYGTQKKKDLTGAVSTISAQQIDKIPTASIANILQGKAAGVDVISNTGEPGGGVTIRIRGTSTLNGGSDPLFIVDGVPMSSEATTSLNMGGTSLNPLADMDPSDIESVQILKDAASAAIYGSRAANGVVIVTTKRGKAGKPTLNLNSTFGVSNIANKIGILNSQQFREYLFEKDMNIGNAPGAVAVDSLAGTNKGDTDFQEAMFQQALIKKLDAKLSGGNEKLRYLVSTGFLDQQGIVIETGQKRVNTRINVDYQAYDKLKIGSSFAYTRSINQRTDQGSNIKGIASIPPVYPIYLPNGAFNVKPNDKLNPVALSYLISNKAITNRFVGSEYFEWAPIKGLLAKSSFSVDYSDVSEEVFRDKSVFIPNASDHRSQFRGVKSLSWLTENILYYSFKLQKHSINLMGAVTFQSWQNSNIGMDGEGYSSNTIKTLNAAGSWKNVSTTESEHTLLSYVSRVNYDYDSKYLASFTFRRDGSSRFGQNNRFADFPSIQLAWKFSEEPILDFTKSWLSHGKIRITHGSVGNESIGNYESQGSYNVGAKYMNLSGIVPGTLFNPNLRWETTTSSNFGLELSFIDEKVVIEADYYLKKTKDLLFRVKVPETSGFADMPSNLGDIENKGLELNLIVRPITTSSFQWTVSGNIAANKNRVLKLPENKDIFTGPSIIRTGESVGTFFGWIMNGVFPSDNDNRFYPKGHEMEGQQITDPNYAGQVVKLTNGLNGATFLGGDVWFADLDKNGIIDENDRTIIGTATPDYFGGISNSFQYKGFRLDIYFNYVMGNDIFSNFRKDTESMVFSANQGAAVLRRWKKPGDITDVPIAIGTDPRQNSRNSTRWIENGSYIKLRNVTLQYTIPQAVTRKIGINKIDLMVQGSNLLTFSNYRGFDPEVNMSDTSFGAGIDNGGYPTSRSFNFGINLEF